MTDITKRIIALKNEKGLNDRQLELAVGLPPASIQAWTKGKKRKDGKIKETSPSIDSVAKIARYFNVSADYLLCLSDEKTEIKKAVLTERPENNTAVLSLEDLKVLLEKNDGIDYIEKLYKELKEKEQRLYVLAWLISYMASEGLPVKQILGK